MCVMQDLAANESRLDEINDTSKDLTTEQSPESEVVHRRVIVSTSISTTNLAE